jgi:hypothetical protein
MRGLPLMITAVAVLVGCAPGPKRVEFGEEYPYGLSSAHGQPAEEFLRGVFSVIHMQSADIDCVVREALEKVQPQVGAGWTKAEINQYMATCAVDVSELWYEQEVGR